MTILETLKNESVQTTTSNTFDVMLSKDFTLDHDNQNYRLLISCEFTVNNKNDKAFLEVILDATQIALDSFKPADNNDPHMFCCMHFVTLDSGLHNLSLNARSESGNTVSVRRARLSVDKF